MDAVSSLIDGIMYAVKNLINKAEYDQTVSGRILSYDGNSQYSVTVNGETHYVKSNGSFKPRDIVEITKPKNKWSRAYISYPNALVVTAEELCDENENLRIQNEELRVSNENARCDAEEQRIQNENDRKLSFEQNVKEVNDAITSYEDIKDDYKTMQSDFESIKTECNSLSSEVNACKSEYEQLSSRMQTSISDCDAATQKCLEITNQDILTSSDLTGFCKLVQENGKVYLEVV